MLGSKRFPREMVLSRTPHWWGEQKKAVNPSVVPEPLVKIWHTVGDGKTRASHIAAHGQARLMGEPFTVGNALLMTPRDPNGPIGEVINCRCQTMLFPLSQLPAEFLPQIEGRLSENQRRFLSQGVRVAQAQGAGPIGAQTPVPLQKPTPPIRNTKPSGPPSSNATIVGVGEKGGSVIIFYSDDTEEVRTGGTRSWRNYNPGNIIAGTFTDSHGAIGRAAGFAVFPDRGTGEAALLSLLKGGAYQPLALNDAIRKYAPSQGGNPTGQYQTFIRNKLGKNGTEILNTFTSGEMNNLVKAIIQFEHWSVGTVRYQKFVSP